MRWSSGAGTGEGIRIEECSDIVVEANLVAFGQGIGMLQFGSTGSVRCNNAFGNAGGDYAGGLSLEANFALDPLFCDRASGNYSLAASSPCLPGGNACGVLIGALGMGCEPALVAPVAWDGLKAAFHDGRPISASRLARRPL